MTEREKILFAREAFAAGLLHSRELARLPVTEYSRRSARQMAEEKYPIPTVTRARTVASGDFEYRVVNGVLESRYRGAHADWSECPWVNVPEVTLLSELIANPLETVEVV